MFITGRHQSELDKAVTAIGGNAAAIRGDTTNLADLDRIYATEKTQAGRIDVLAANAGVYEFAAFGEITEEHFDKTFNTNVRGLSFAVQKALPLLAKGSSVILIGSMVSIKGFASCSVYDATKTAIRSFARGWIVDLKGRDIRVNVLSPGYTATPGLAHFLTDQQQAEAVASVPLGRIGTPDDLGKAAVFLASDAGPLALEARRRALADIAVAADDGELAGEHHVGGALDAVDEALAAAIEVVEFRLGDVQRRTWPQFLRADRYQRHWSGMPARRRP